MLDLFGQAVNDDAGAGAARDLFGLAVTLVVSVVKWPDLFGQDVNDDAGRALCGICSAWPSRSQEAPRAQAGQIVRGQYAPAEVALEGESASEENEGWTPGVPSGVHLAKEHRPSGRHR